MTFSFPNRAKVIACVLTLGVFILYAHTLVPSVLDGDQGEFQFMPAFLGIPHPSGFPLYVLLGHLWSYLPVGGLAYRMNLFSACCGALTAGAFFIALCRQKLHLLVALGGAITLALLPQFWQYATAAAVYRLHTLLVVLLFAFLAEWETTRRPMWLWLAALAFGLDLANHLTISFFAPATGIFVLLVVGRELLKHLRVLVVSALLLTLPLVLYLYFPLRAAQLLSDDFVLPGWRRAVSQGIVSPLYQNSWQGLFEFTTGAAFLRTATERLPWKWDTLLQDWTALLLQDVNGLIVAAALLGVIALSRRRAKLAVWVIGVTTMLQVVALQYSYAGLATIGQMSPYFREYFLPSFITLIVLACWGMDGLQRALQTIAARLGFRSRAATAVAPALLVGVLLLAPLPDLIARRPTALHARSAELQAQWDTIKKYPPENNAMLAGHWGDLTPLWYYQHADNWRRDLLTTLPPTDEGIDAWLATGKPLYLAGPLLDWAPKVATKHRLTPWGPLVRVSDREYLPASPLPSAAQWTFEDVRPSARVLGYEVSRDTARVGDMLDVAIYWEVLDTLTLDDYALYLSLANKDGATPAQPFTLAVNWLPGKKLSAGQRALGTYRFAIPWGTRPDTYGLRVVLYSIRRARHLDVVETAQPSAEIAKIAVEQARQYPDAITVENPTRADFGHRVVLLGWEGNVKELRTGDRANIQLLWKAVATPLPNLRTSLFLENANGARLVGETALAADYPAAQWRAGEIVRATHTFLVPADLPEGNYALTLRVREESSPAALGLYDGWFLRGDTHTLARVRVTGRAHVYTIPSIPHPQAANFGNRITLLGYALSASSVRAGESLQATLYWQSLAVMSESYKVFVHLVDAQGKIWAQHDAIPGAGALPTTGWLPREVIGDTSNLSLPADAPPGLYRVRIGFYDEATGKRIDVLDANNRAVQDFVALESAVQVTRK